MNRHKLKSHKQTTESIEEFLQTLYQLAKKCSTPALTADQHREMLIVDAFIAGLSSPQIRQRLLESHDDSLSTLSKTAITMELAMADAHSLSSQFQSSQITVSSTRQSNCLYCGKTRHKDRLECPARSSVCNNCHRRGHWASVCMSKPNLDKSNRTTIRKPKNLAIKSIEDDYGTEDEPDNIKLSSTLAVTTNIHRNSGLTLARFNNIPILCLIDTGADNTFIQRSFLIEHKLSFSRNKKRILCWLTRPPFRFLAKL